jgi:hypothetical protein
MAACGGEQPMSYLAQFLPDQVDNWRLSDSTSTYNRQSIFDYINGAGEVYRSFAFGEVLVARYSRQGSGDISVELFDMGNPADAYGVFSYARESEEMGIGGGYERKGGVLCFWQNRYYVCVAADQSSGEPTPQLVELARTISEQLPAESERPNLVAMLPTEGMVAFSERFFHNHQSLNYHYYLARENLLGLNPGTDVVMARYQPGSSYVVIVRHENENEAIGSLFAFRQGYVPDNANSQTAQTERGKYVSSRQYSRFVVVVLDAVSERQADQLAQATVERLTESLNWGN